jgi:hypothetical protein
MNGSNGMNGVDGVNGVNGVNGTNGQNGVNGADGVSVTSANITNDSLYLSLSNSQTLNAGKITDSINQATIINFIRFKRMVVFETLGIQNWSITPGVDSIDIEIWSGAGGGGGQGGGAHWSNGNAIGGHGGKGGNGGYYRGKLNVTGKQTLTIKVGDGGQSGQSGTDFNAYYSLGGCALSDGSSGSNGDASAVDTIEVPGGHGGGGGGLSCSFWWNGQVNNANGSNGTNGIDGQIINFNYASSVNRTFIPANFINSQPDSHSKGGLENIKGEAGLVIIRY